MVHHCMQYPVYNKYEIYKNWKEANQLYLALGMFLMVFAWRALTFPIYCHHSLTASLWEREWGSKSYFMGVKTEAQSGQRTCLNSQLWAQSKTSDSKSASPKGSPKNTASQGDYWAVILEAMKALAWWAACTLSVDQKGHSMAWPRQWHPGSQMRTLRNGWRKNLAKDPQLGSSSWDSSPSEEKGGAEGQAVLLQVREAVSL